MGRILGCNTLLSYISARRTFLCFWRQVEKLNFSNSTKVFCTNREKILHENEWEKWVTYFKKFSYLLHLLVNFAKFYAFGNSKSSKRQSFFTQNQRQFVWLLFCYHFLVFFDLFSHKNAKNFEKRESFFH